MMDAGNVLKSAVATGPGLPSPGGVMFAKDPADSTKLVMTTATTSLPTMATTFFTMPDATITPIPDNAPFVFSFYSSSPPRNNPVEQRTMTFPRRSFTRAEATGTSGLLPTVAPANNLATHSFSTMMGNIMGMMRMGERDAFHDLCLHHPHGTAVCNDVGPFQCFEHCLQQRGQPDATGERELHDHADVGTCKCPCDGHECAYRDRNGSFRKKWGTRLDVQ